ncbi:endoplasmic reticulum membrane protein complex subunit 7-like [Antedon mediterranea]|uniref:endoplasmic reticulum membrane protein complex subunit 7-like n=1 Tax=Antedon mediterranea TaxID=105859 RepID=UPI003AF60587
MKEIKIIVLVICLGVFQVKCEDTDEDNNSNTYYTIEGKVIISGAKLLEWLPETRILVDGGAYVGFMRADGSFTVGGVPSGSYVVEVSNPKFLFEPARVEINGKGKMRARKVNLIQPNKINLLSYPLRMKSKTPKEYFQKREEFRVTDALKNPMVLMMVVPLICIVVLPKLINSQDPEVQREMQQSMSFMNQNQNLPDLSEMMTNWLGGTQPTKKRDKSKVKKK